jgi:hypothetical protein
VTVPEHVRLINAATPEDWQELADAFKRAAYPRGAPQLPDSPTRTVELPETAPCWIWGLSLIGSGLMEMVERIYPTNVSQAQ